MPAVQHSPSTSPNSFSSDSDGSIPSLKLSPRNEITNLSDIKPLINAVRFLAADTVLNAGSGHTGMPMGMAPATTLLWNNHMNFSPKNPSFINRDRFILSAGHGSALLYSLLHIFNVQDSISLSDLKSFRTHPSSAPGHPENAVTVGVEVTSGALGQGIANAVGFALAESHLRAVYGRAEFSPIDHHIYCVVGDGCLMEGISAEVCSLAGHWKLSHLIVLYDDNSISIEGSTDLAFTEDVSARFEAINWQVLTVEDGNNDLKSIHEAISLAKAETSKPSLIRIKSTIGYGTSLAGTAKIHGPCLDAKIIEKAKSELKWEYSPFHVPDEVREAALCKTDEGDILEADWNEQYLKYRSEFPELASQFESLVLKEDCSSSLKSSIDKLLSQIETTPSPTRKISGKVLNELAVSIPSLIGGSADLAPSTNTHLTKFDDYQFDSPVGRNIHFGVREHGMGSICNGIALHGTGLIPFCSTFLVFSDYMRASIRTAALAEARVIFIMTHDSVFLGQDGPTHQPIEHLSSLRAMPNVFTIRPSNAIEVAVAYEIAIKRTYGPTVLALSRQSYPIYEKGGNRQGVLKGGYVFQDEEEGSQIDGVIIATGSEVGIATEAATTIRSKGLGVRIVSMPCVELFLEQPRKYQKDTLAQFGRDKILVVEAASSLGWYRFSDHIMSLDRFGVSAPAKQVANILQINAPVVVKRFEQMVNSGGMDI